MIFIFFDFSVGSGNSVSETVTHQRSRSPYANTTPPTWLLLLALVIVQVSIVCLIKKHQL